MKKEIPVYKIEIPEYAIGQKPNFVFVGSKLDEILKNHYLNQEVVVRALGSQEHSDKAVEELIEIIKTSGTDRYDSNREGDRYENIENKRIDFFAMLFAVTNSGEYFKDLIGPFYLYPEKPVRVDIAIVYDPEQLEIVEHQYEGREGEIKKDGYVFKNQDNRQKAVRGIIHIL